MESIRIRDPFVLGWSSLALKYGMTPGTAYIPATRSLRAQTGEPDPDQRGAGRLCTGNGGGGSWGLGVVGDAAVGLARGLHLRVRAGDGAVQGRAPPVLLLPRPERRVRRGAGVRARRPEGERGGGGAAVVAQRADPGASCCLCAGVVSVDGAAYWLTKAADRVVSFDVREERVTSTRALPAALG